MICVVLATVIIVNLVQFRTIDSDRADRFSVLHAYATSDLMTEGLAEDHSIVDRYAMHEVLATLAPESIIRYDTSRGIHWRTVHRFYAFGDAQHVNFVELGDIEVPSPETQQLTVAQSDGDPRHTPWAILADPDAQSVGDSTDPQGFVQELLATPWRPPTDAPALTFYYVRWSGTSAGEAIEYNLLVEDTLMPASTNEEAHSDR